MAILHRSSGRRPKKLLKTYRWQNFVEVWRDGIPQTGGGDGMVTFSSRPRFLLPFAPEDKIEWTEEHYIIYDLVQLAIGQKRELTEKEIREQEQLERVDAIESGESDENILDVMKELFPDTSGMEMFLSDDRTPEMMEIELDKKFQSFMDSEEISLNDEL